MIEEAGDIFGMTFRKAAIDANHTWLTEGLQPEFDGFIALGSKEQKSSAQEAKGVLFKKFSCGVVTSRDAWVYHFNRLVLARNIQKTIGVYNDHVLRWQYSDKKTLIDDFVACDDKAINWSRGLKHYLARGKQAACQQDHIRTSLYRPFTKLNLYFDRMFNQEVYIFPSIFPNTATEHENRVICCSGIGNSKPFHSLMTDYIPCFDLLEKTQCFPFYTYDEDGTHRRENIPEWALQHFCAHYGDATIDRWAIFHYIYGLLHHPDYRTRYAANLRRALPRVPLVKDFWAYSRAGKALADLHVDYDQQPEYPLKKVYKPNTPHDWTVRKMRLTPDKTALQYNDWLTLTDIPENAFAYRLGNRSALEWVIEQYQIKTDPRSGITNDPNRPDDPQAILRLIAQVVQVSVETVRIVEKLPPLLS